MKELFEEEASSVKRADLLQVAIRLEKLINRKANLNQSRLSIHLEKFKQ